MADTDETSQESLPGGEGPESSAVAEPDNEQENSQASGEDTATTSPPTELGDTWHN
jgi:hypothetical protein